MMKVLAEVATAALVFAGLCVQSAASDLVLNEHLGYDWQESSVSFPLSRDDREQAQAGHALTGADGREVVWQLAPDGEQLWLRTDLPAGATQRFSFDEKPASHQSDLTLTETADELRIENRFTGLRLRRRLAPGQGPIAGVRLQSGRWTAGSTLKPDGRATTAAYDVTVLARGPIYVEIECRMTFADDGYWRLRFRIDSNEPAIRVEEDYDAPTGGTHSLVLGDDTSFRPSHMLVRDSRVERATVQSRQLGNYLLEPWLHWNNGNHGTWLALYTPSPPRQPATTKREPTPDLLTGDTAGDAMPLDAAETADAAPPASQAVRQPPTAADDMLMIAMLHPGDWCDPNWQGHAKQTPTNVQAAVRDGLLAVDFPVSGGRRVWLLGTLDRRDSEPLVGQRVAPPPQALAIRHGERALDRVRDFVLDWQGDADNHPILFVRKADLPALRARLVSDPQQLRRWRDQQPVDKYFIDEAIKEFLATGDAKLGRRIAEKGMAYLQTVCDWYLTGDYLHCPGTAPHMQQFIITSTYLLDAVLSTDILTDPERRQVLARLALVGYVTGSQDYWSPARGYTGFANMTSVVALYRTILGCLLPNHPEAEAWRRQGLNQLTWQLTAWSDADGGWYEAPHYAMVSFDHMVAGFTMAANAGLGDQLYHPRMRKVIEWFAAISTPRDSRMGGIRHQPPIGNTYHGEPNGLYGLVAALYDEKDPTFAAQMQWLHAAHGNYQGLGIGWNFPATAGYRFLAGASGIEPQPAELGSRLFRKTGVVLRNTMAGERETYLHMIAGSNHDHYDDDSGSIVLYGKGRILADDWGYIGRHPGQWHSMLSSGATGGLMNVDDFSTQPGFDYVTGKRGAWRRQIAFAKDADPLAPNYFLIRDTHSADAAATWRLWLTALEPPGAGKAPPTINADLAGADDDMLGLDDGAESKKQRVGVEIHSQGATLTGGEDVDLDIFIYDAKSLGLKTREASQRSNSTYRRNGQVPATMTQTELSATLKGEGAVKTAAGTDYVFAAPTPEVVRPEPKGFVALPTGETIAKSPSHAWRGTEAPWFIVNGAEQSLKTEVPMTMPVGVYVHPGATVPVTVAWQSPGIGEVSAKATVRRLPADKANAPPDKNDGVVAELRLGDRTLAKVAGPSGSAAIELAAKDVRIRKGELLRLVILAGGCHWFDTTQLDLDVQSAEGHRWQLAEALLAGGKLANDLPEDEPTGVWWAGAGDGQTVDRRLLVEPEATECVTADSKVGFTGTAGRIQVRDGAATLVLGAAGTVRFGREALTADGPGTRGARP
jgi:hypothetical protein